MTIKGACMTAHELAQALLAGPDLPVFFTYNYGDYWHTRVAAPVGTAEEGEVAWSEYHRMNKVFDAEEGDGGDGPEREGDEKGDEVILLG